MKNFFTSFTLIVLTVALPLNQIYAVEAGLSLAISQVNQQINSVDLEAAELVAEDRKLEAISGKEKKIKRIVKRIQAKRDKVIKKFRKKYKKMSPAQFKDKLDDLRARAEELADHGSLEFLNKLNEAGSDRAALAEFEALILLNSAPKIAAEIVEAGGLRAFIKQQKQKLQKARTAMADDKSEGRKVASETFICSGTFVWISFTIGIAFLAGGGIFSTIGILILTVGVFPGGYMISYMMNCYDYY